MPLTFSPALGEQTVLKVAPKASDQFAAQTVLFKATFDSRESLLNHCADGIKVELWSDVPVFGRPSGEWGAVEFGSLEPETVLPEGAQIFSPGSVEERDSGAAQENSLYIPLRVPLHDHVGARFSFTYRLVHPSGHVQWLGEYGRNGELVVEQGLPGVDLREGWNITEDGTYRTHAFPGERVLGHLTDPNIWSSWSWKASSVPAFTQATEVDGAFALVLLPRPDTHAVNVPRPLVFVASHSTSLKITERGTIILNSSSPFARVSFSVLEHSKELLNGVAALSHGELLAFDRNSAVVASRLTDAGYPVHLLVLPMADDVTGRAVLPLRHDALPKEASEWDGLVLASPDVHYVKAVPQPIAEGELAWLGAASRHVIVAPYHAVVVDDSKVHVAILTSHEKLDVRVDRSVTHTLPTPPPSPPRSREPSPASSVSHPRTQPRNSPSSPAQPSTPRQKRVRPATPLPVRSTSSALIRRQPTSVIRRYIHMVLNVFVWFWSGFVRAVATRIVGESTTRRVTGFLGLALLKTAPPAVPRASAEDRPEVLDETDEEEDEDVQAEHAAHDADAATEVPAERIIESVPAIQVLSDASPKASPSVQTRQRVVLSAILPSQLPESPVVFLAGEPSIKEVRTTVDGKASPSPSITSLDSGDRLLRLMPVATGGQLEITLDL
ncbi:hypothetical protein BD413DRAFT_479435 [Trametes elegans]|nr:hypothetical protein BD413DRAFT_479435 [Trametes elegans]